MVGKVGAVRKGDVYLMYGRCASRAQEFPFLAWI